MTIKEMVDRYIGYPPEIDESVSTTIARTAYRQGAKDVFEEIVKWLDKHTEEYIWYDEVTADCGFNDDFVEALRKDIFGD